MFICKICGCPADEGAHSEKICLNCMDSDLLFEYLDQQRRKRCLSTLRLRRITLGYSQEDLAALCGCSRQYYGLIENGVANPSLSICVAICDALDCSLNDFLNDLWNEKEKQDN